MLTHKELKKRALERADVKAEYESLDEEFALLDELLKAKAATPRATRYSIHTATGGKSPAKRGAYRR
jgi:hypothetical protein